MANPLLWVTIGLQKRGELWSTVKIHAQKLPVKNQKNNAFWLPMISTGKLEQLTSNQQVEGSSPSGVANFP
ncbi:hypothetical protein [Roseicyclus marinus]|uniref:hypothetical protein n=1 Tax=Roseicyclus marinus TaxID=2161673 RepID=UPI0030C70B27